MNVSIKPRDQRVFFQQQDVLMFSCNNSGQIESANQAFFHLLGFNLLSIIGKNITDMIEMEAEANKKSISEILTCGNYVRFLQNDGSGLWFKLASVVFNQGKFSVIACQFEHEVALKKETEDYKNKLYRIINMVPHPIFLKDKNRRYEIVNNAQAKLHGLKTFEMLGKTDKELDVNLTESFIIDTSDKEVLEKKEKVFLKEQPITSRKGEFILQTTKIPFKSEIDGTTKILGISIDVTDIKLAERNLKEINLDLDTFIYRSSHDMLAPILSIKGLTHLLKLSGSEEEKQKCINKINGSLNRLEKYIATLTNYSKNLRIQSKFQDIDLKKMILNLLKDLIIDYPMVELETSYNISSPFSSDSERTLIILKNILLNAFHFSTQNTTPFVSIKTSVNSTKAIITVEDNGGGIKKDIHHKIFEMFYRGSCYSNGSGLGLYIAKEMIKKLDGTIRCISDENQGAVFEIMIPNNYE